MNTFKVKNGPRIPGAFLCERDAAAAYFGTQAVVSFGPHTWMSVMTGDLATLYVVEEEEVK